MKWIPRWSTRWSTRWSARSGARWAVPLSSVLALLAAVFFSLGMSGAPAAADGLREYTLGPGDSIRILVFQNPDLTLDTRVSESGTITYPLIGSVTVGGLAISRAERRIADALRTGGFVKQPQVNIVLGQVRGSQVAVLGHVNRPGRFPLETFNSRLSELLATAGGIIGGNGPAPGGADRVILVGTRDGKPFRKEVDVSQLFTPETGDDDLMVAPGDVIYVPAAPVYYIYGEVQRPGTFRIERGMTIRQALAQSGGPTPRGTERGLRVHRKGADGKVSELDVAPTDPVQANDVIYVSESWF
jgi:polysaccharide biosynthesis/export protein